MRLFYSFGFFLSLSLVLMKGYSQNQASFRLSLVGQVQYADRLNDVWAYVAPDGTEYAIIGTTEGVSIVDLSDPINPNEVQFIPGASSTWRDMKTFGEFAYVSNETNNGITILDLSGLPNNIESKDTIIANVFTSHNLYVDDGILYVVGITSGVFNQGMILLDLESDPWRPDLVGFYDQTYVHDVFVRDGVAYSAELGVGLTLVDIQNPEEVNILGNVDYAEAFTHNTWLNDAGTVCFTTDERAGASIKAWDVSDPTNIVILDEIRASLSDGLAAPHNVHVLDDYLISSYYSDGIQIVDASRPNNLIEVGYFDTSFAEGASFDGCWGAYPFLPSGLILASDIQEGLFILQPEYVRGAYFEGTVVDDNTEEPLDNVQITILNENNQLISDENGRFATGTASGGTFEVVFTRFGYKADTLNVTLANGILVEEQIRLAPGEVVGIDISVVDASTGEPIPDAQVSLEPVFGEVFGEVFFTNSTGTASTSLIESQYEVIAGKWGYRSQQLIFDLVEGSQSVTLELVLGYYDDFSLDFGWQTGGDAVDGAWVRERPVGTNFFDIPMNPSFDAEEDLGELAFITGNQGITFDDDDVDSGRVFLQSPIFNLANISEPVLRYRWWLINFFPFNPFNVGNDSLVIQLSDGIDTVTLITHEDRFANRWIEDEFMISDFMEPKDGMFLIVSTTDVPEDNVMEAGFDFFEIEGEISTTTSIDPTKIEAPGFQLYPVPVKNELFIRRPSSFQKMGNEAIVNIYSIHGKLVRRTIWNLIEEEFSIPFDYNSGIYFVEILVDGQRVYQRKFLK